MLLFVANIQIIEKFMSSFKEYPDVIKEYVHHDYTISNNGYSYQLSLACSYRKLIWIILKTTTLKKRMSLQCHQQSVDPISDINTRLSSDDTRLIESIDHIRCHPLIQGRFDELNTIAVDEIERFIFETKKKKENLAIKVCKIYNALNNAFYSSLRSRRMLEVKIHGIYKQKYEQPSVEVWIKDNPDEYLPVKTFIDELTQNGYSPRMKISKFNLINGKVYVGGVHLIVTCSFV